MKAGREIDFSETAPRWSWRAVLLAVLMTGLIYFLIPMTERMSPQPAQDLKLRELDTVRMPPPRRPPPPPQPDPPPLAQSSAALPQPSVPETRPPAAPRPLPVDLQSSVSGLLKVSPRSFTVQGEGLQLGVTRGVFEISDLDQPPRPVVQVPPVYPPQARMRRVEGFVAVEFVVGLDGQVQDLQITDSEPGELFVQAVRRAVRGWRFSPGEMRGEAVPSRVRQRIDFTLE
ncbi:MAG: energy transducer TonB [Kiritimatiellia bacterium]